jgi:pentatricopeptide repeat protein
MYVRHQDIEASTRIYRKYFDYFHRKRDSWTYSIMLEGCYNWKDVDLGTEVFRDWRDWRKSTGKLTDKKSRYSDYQCYRRMINLLARYVVFVLYRCYELWIDMEMSLIQWCMWRSTDKRNILSIEEWIILMSPSLY